MVTIYHFSNSTIRQITIKELCQLLPEPDGVIWIDLENPNEAEEETILVSLFNIHPLAIEDCQRGKDTERHLPKVEDFDDYLFVIFNPLANPVRSENGDRVVDVRTVQLSSFIFNNCLITHHFDSMPAIDQARQLVVKNPHALGRGPDYFFHIIADTIVDQYSPAMDHLDDAIDETEKEVFHKPSERTLIRILHLKKNVLAVRRIAVYQREMLNRLSRGEFSLITPEEMIYYRNVYDHLVRMSDLADSYRDMVAGLLDAYLSVTSNKLSQVMKVLTIISTIFLPLSFITGWFGMNFRVIPIADLQYGILFATFLMVGVAGGMVWWFKRNNWM